MALVRAKFTYSGNQQSWTVPAGVTSATFEVYGARGGPSNGSAPTHPNYEILDSLDNYGAGSNYYYSEDLWANPGGYASGVKTVTPGDVYYVFVGGHGAAANTYDSSNTAKAITGGAGGYNGGGKGGNGYQGANYPSGSSGYGEALGGGGGGGATDIRYGGTSTSNRILVAGGSGGEGGGTASSTDTGSGGDSSQPTKTTWAQNPSSPTPPFYTSALNGYGDPSNGTNLTYVSAGNGIGGWGGTTTGGRGGPGTGISGGNDGAAGGYGGSQSAAGAAGTNTQTGGVNGAAGSGASGGAGANATNTTATQTSVKWGFGGGGGAGGYYGGGGGATGYGEPVGTGGGGFAGGGGGGSNYVDPSLTSPKSYAHVTAHDYTYEGASTFTSAQYAGAVSWGSYALITYTQPPNLPQSLSVQNGQAIAAGTDLPVSWTWSSSAPSPDNPSTQYPAVVDGGADIAWSVHGANSWTQSHDGGTSDGKHTHTIPGSAFTAGNSYDIRVRLYDNYGDVGNWLMVTVSAVALPPTPHIDSPAAGATVTPTGTAPNYTVPITWDMNSAGSPELAFDLTLASSKYRQALGPIKTHTRMNFAPDPDCTTPSAWLGVGWASKATQTTYKKFGTSTLKVSWTAAQVNAYVEQQVTTYPGAPYTFSLYVAAGTATSDPGVYLQAVDTATGNVLASSDPSAAWGTVGTFQRLDVQFYAQGATTYLQVVTADGVSTPSGSSLIVDGALAEIGLAGDYTGAADPLPFVGFTKHDAAVTGTFATVGGFATVQNADVLSYSVPWTYGSDTVTATLYVSTLASLGADSKSPDTKTFSLSIAPPGTPSVSVVSDDDSGTITLTITANNTPNPTTWFDVYRTDTTTGKEIALGLTLFPDSSGNLTFVDYTPASGVTYNYRVRAHSALGFVDVT